MKLIRLFGIIILICLVWGLGSAFNGEDYKPIDEVVEESSSVEQNISFLASEEEIVFDEDSGSFYQVKPYYWFRVIENKYGNAHNVRVHVAIDEGFYFKKDYKTYVSVDEVNAYFADLKENYYRVANSQMIIIEWSAIDGYGTLSQEDLAEKMADMLLSSDQKFIREPEDCK